MAILIPTKKTAGKCASKVTVILNKEERRNMSKVVSITSAEHYKWGNNCDGWHLLKTEELSIIQEEVPPGESEVKHYHNKSKQFFYILEGKATIDVSGKENEINKNEGIYIEAGLEHQVFNNSIEPLKFIVISSPISHGDRVNINK